MEWVEQLKPRERRGSRPRCLLLTDDGQGDVAQRLTRLVSLPEVKVSPDDIWIPYGKPIRMEDGSWDMKPAHEVELDKPNKLVCHEIQKQLQGWWLAIRGRGRGARTPNWDIASTCRIRGKPGLLLVEAKAHAEELSSKSDDKCGSGNPSNRERIKQAMAEAIDGLHAASGGLWNLSRDHHYQLSNRFAWAWKLATLEVPVVLVYLGFLNAQDMVGKELFHCESDWKNALKTYSKGIIDNTGWERWLDIKGTCLLPLIRVYDQPFNT